MKRTASTPAGGTRNIQHAGGTRRTPARGLLPRRMLALFLATTAATASIGWQAPARALADAPCGGDTTEGMGLGVGTQTYLSESVDQSTMSSDALAGVIAWRQDALNSTARLWDGMTMKAYLARHGISPDAYLHPQWSHDLERIALQRAAETNVNWGHTRPNGQAWNSVTSSGIQSQAEVLATAGLPEALDDWAAEKQQVLDHPDADNSQTAGHYLFLIDPAHQGYGFADANGGAGVGEASDLPPTDQTPTGWAATCSFRIPALASDLTTRLSPTSAAVGQTRTLMASATGTWTGMFTPQQQTTLQLRGTYASDDPAVATIDDGVLTAQGVGSTNVSITSGDQQLGLGSFLVDGRQIVSITDPAITTASGRTPLLPSTVLATWNDGHTSEEPVTWAALPSTWRNRAGGRFTLAGTVDGWGGPVTLTVTVTPATFVGVRDVAITTTAGVAPVLPTTVAGTWSNGDTTNQPVTWDAPAASAYAHPGTVTITGHATGPDATTWPTTATVTVKAALPSFLAPVGAMPRATGLVGEATGDRLADVWAIDAAGNLTFFRNTGTALVNLGVRGRNLQDITAIVAIPDMNGDHRADVLYRTKSDGALWFGYSQGNGYLRQGPRAALGWNGSDQIFYAGPMVAGSSTQYVVARHADGTLWRYPLTAKGLSSGVQIATRWSSLRLIMSAGNVWGDGAWDVVGVTRDGTVYGYRNQNGVLRNIGVIARGWSSTTAAFGPGDLTGDGHPDLLAVHGDASVWAQAISTRGITSLGRRATGFRYLVAG